MIESIETAKFAIPCLNERALEFNAPTSPIL